jgi:hypothetical protein
MLFSTGRKNLYVLARSLYCTLKSSSSAQEDFFTCLRAPFYSHTLTHTHSTAVNIFVKHFRLRDTEREASTHITTLSTLTPKKETTITQRKKISRASWKKNYRNINERKSDKKKRAPFYRESTLMEKRSLSRVSRVQFFIIEKCCGGSWLLFFMMVDYARLLS